MNEKCKTRQREIAEDVFYTHLNDPEYERVSEDTLWGLALAYGCHPFFSCVTFPEFVAIAFNAVPKG